MTQTHEHDCGRAGDLVAYVYGEAHEAEADDFTCHLASCATCRTEVAAFGIVRKDFALWRAAAPELTSAHAARFVAEHVATSSAEMNRAAPLAETRRESDSDQLRSLRRTWQTLAELFRVTPLWAQASGAVCVLAVCVLAGTSLNNSRTPTPNMPNEVANVATMNPGSYAGERIAAPNESEIESRINREVARRLAEREEAEAVSGARAITTTASLRDDNARARTSPRRTPARSRRSSTKSPAEGFGNEADLPRLSDLLDGAE